MLVPPHTSKLCIIFKNDYSHTALSTKLPCFPSSLFTFETSPLSFRSTCSSCKSPAPSCLTLGFLAFSVDVDQTPVKYWTSHSIQSSFLLLFIYFSFSSRYSVLGFPFCCVCILCTWSARKVWMVTRFPLAEIYYFLMLRNWLWPLYGNSDCFLKMFFSFLLFIYFFFKLFFIAWNLVSRYKEVWNQQQP